MTVRELISANAMLTDIEIDVRDKGSLLVDSLHIGPDFGVVPPHPMRIGQNGSKQATYIIKNINSWDDGRDYWEIKVNRMPEKWLELEVFSWSNRHVYQGHHYRDDMTHSMEGLLIVALPSGQSLEVKEEKKEQKAPEQLAGQTDIFDFLEG